MIPKSTRTTFTELANYTKCSNINRYRYVPNLKKLHCKISIHKNKLTFLEQFCLQIYDILMRNYGIEKCDKTSRYYRSQNVRTAKCNYIRNVLPFLV